MKLPAFVLLILLSATCGFSADTFRPPNPWEGMSVGTEEGNPALENGKPLWRLDFVWPDSPLVAANYLPLKWAEGIGGLAWRAPEHEHGGQPSLSFAPNGEVLMGARTAWTGKPGVKTPALVFIAPGPGKAVIAGQLSAKFFQGNGPVKILFLHKAKGSDSLTEISQFELTKENADPQQVNGVESTVAEGDELVVVPQFPKLGNAAAIRILDFEILFSPDASKK